MKNERVAHSEKNDRCGDTRENNKRAVKPKIDGVLMDRKFSRKLKGKFLDACIIPANIWNFGEGSSVRTASTQTTDI